MSAPSASSPFGLLGQFVRPRRNVERCELCSLELAEEHPHLLDLGPAADQPNLPIKILCSCQACAILFESQTRYRRIPTEVEYLADFAMTENQWEDLRLPINLAFFFYRSQKGKMVVCYPSPAGATEALLPLDAWPELVERNPVLARLQPDVEALLVNRIDTCREHYRVPIDECYKLVGLIRANWRGLGGGIEVWRAVEAFFRGLRQRGGT